MRKIVLILVVLLLAVTLTYAQEPDASPSENACNPGGALEGKCNSDWHWTCGWYLAQFYEGKAAGVPSDCQILVSVLPADLQKPGALVYVGTYNPERGTAADNACNEGGVMAGKCNSEWHWTCGWYLARYDAGVITSVPATCQILLDVRPPKVLPEAEAAAQTKICAVVAGPYGLCLIGNILEIDFLNDGTIDFRDLLLMDNIVGPSGLCPLGTTYAGDHSSYNASIEAFVLAQGFPLNGDGCSLP